MNYSESKLEKWINKLPECGEFLGNFFDSCREDTVSALVNYINDICSYGSTKNYFRRNHANLLMAFEDIAGLRILYG